eukprot:TRINITY_DN827_c0_g1_i1.p1 TRINITY_DN827_c0_g1~~TRINITY_DN827_c0_g1_i1.p1  ORF type:complete len:102 (+),score=9.01 TRINITY_DN827_c0_g1_i1:24-308(+)
MASAPVLIGVVRPAESKTIDGRLPAPKPSVAVLKRPPYAAPQDKPRTVPTTSSLADDHLAPPMIAKRKRPTDAPPAPGRVSKPAAKPRPAVPRK